MDEIAVNIEASIPTGDTCAGCRYKKEWSGHGDSGGECVLFMPGEPYGLWTVDHVYYKNKKCGERLGLPPLEKKDVEITRLEARRKAEAEERKCIIAEVEAYIFTSSPSFYNPLLLSKEALALVPNNVLEYALKMRIAAMRASTHAI